MDGASVRQRIAAARTAGLGRRRRGFPADVRRMVMAYLERRVARGVSRNAVARELGLGVSTLESWTKRRVGTAIVPAFRQMQVVEGVNPSSPIVVYGSRGVRVEGLDVSQVAELMRRLG